MASVANIAAMIMLRFLSGKSVSLSGEGDFFALRRWLFSYSTNVKQKVSRKVCHSVLPRHTKRKTLNVFEEVTLKDPANITSQVRASFQMILQSCAWDWSFEQRGQVREHDRIQRAWGLAVKVILIA